MKEFEGLMNAKDLKNEKEHTISDKLKVYLESRIMRAIKDRSDDILNYEDNVDRAVVVMSEAERTIAANELLLPLFEKGYTAEICQLCKITRTLTRNNTDNEYEYEADLSNFIDLYAMVITW